MSTGVWPTATLDPIRRARVLAAAVPGGFAEVVIDAPYARVWSWLRDLERSVPAFDTQVDDLRITSRAPHPAGTGEEIRFVATNHRIPIPFRARLEDGWCLMQARGRAFVVVMAAIPDGADRTRYAQLEAVPLPGGRLLRRRLTRDVGHDVDCIRKLLAP
jgi:hypothetical protein